MRRFLSALLVIQGAFAFIGATSVGPGRLASDPQVAFELGVAFFVVSAAFLLVVRRLRSIDLLEIVGLAAGLISLAFCVLGQRLDPTTAVAVTLYEAIAIAIAAFAIPWRMGIHVAWVSVAAAAAVYGLVSTLGESAERTAILGAVVFACVISILGKATAWNGRVELHVRQVEIRRLNARLRATARIDWGTGVGNRLALDEHLGDLARHPSGRVGLAVLDLDRFKGVNDAFGHAAGDATLRAVVDQIKSEVRDSDRVFRYGGEEFIVIFHRLDEGGAALAAERLRVAVERAHLPNPAASNDIVTISIGTIELMLPVAREGLRAAIEVADANLYAAKRAGRNLVRSGLPGSAPSPIDLIPGSAARPAAERG